MSDDSRTGAPSRMRAIAGLSLLLVLAGGFTLYRRIDALSDRIGVIVGAKRGSIRVAADEGVPTSVQWLVDPADPRLVVVPAGSNESEGWDEVVARVLPGSSLESSERATVTRQSIGAGSGKREVIAERVLLVIAPPGGPGEPAVGIGVGIAREGDSKATIARTIVRLVGATGASERIDAAPLFHDSPATLLDRVKGIPAHVVRFELEVMAELGSPDLPSSAPPPAGSSATEPKPLDEEEARRAIDKLRRERPERGVIPPPASPPPPSETPPPAPGTSE